jgi:hypothetical protein
MVIYLKCHKIRRTIAIGSVHILLPNFFLTKSVVRETMLLLELPFSVYLVPVIVSDSMHPSKCLAVRRILVSDLTLFIKL